MKASSIVATRRPVSRLVFGRVAVPALLIALAVMAWHRTPAVAQTVSVPPASQDASSRGDSKNLPLEFWML
ncbi:MAG TPA: hypothetical protein VLA61_10930 [Ideonella sp.]|uniref:hypothetical protein n=1 Tax=Ideonella sp. TaxID=1929293 RepID=UPI002D19D15B|nr:hypothetical protein [Ideonella sp.]HSI48776.1 hypothetical protein [Ideonella sp.]